MDLQLPYDQDGQKIYRIVVGVYLPMQTMTVTTKCFIPTWQGVLDTTTFSMCDRIGQRLKVDW